MKHSLVIITAVVALLTALCVPAWAINKCTVSDGKVVYQDAPCAGKGETIDVRPNSVMMPLGAAPKITTAAPEVSTSDGLQTTVAQQPSPAQSPLTLEADACLNWYRPKLRDPAGAYYSAPSKDSRVLTLTVHATNRYGGYDTQVAEGEFFNGRLDSDWTKIHAKRNGWPGD